MIFQKLGKILAICSIFCLPVAFGKCTSADDEIARRAAEAQQKNRAGVVADGAAIFKKFCVACHGADGKLGLNGAKDLSQTTLSREECIQQITNGKGLMTPFREILNPREIEAVADYALTLKK